MKKMDIILIRHGESVANEKKLFSGKSEHPLTEKGKQQCEITADRLQKYDHIKRIYSSPLKRAADTARYMADKNNRELVFKDELKEIDFGIFEGMTKDQMIEENLEVWQNWNNDFVNYALPEGESVLDLSKRVNSFVDELIEKGEDCIVVSHGVVIQSIIIYLLEMKLEQIWRFKVKNASCIKIEYNDGFGFIKNMIPAE